MLARRALGLTRHSVLGAASGSSRQMVSDAGSSSSSSSSTRNADQPQSRMRRGPRNRRQHKGAGPYLPGGLVRRAERGTLVQINNMSPSATANDVRSLIMRHTLLKGQLPELQGRGEHGERSDMKPRDASRYLDKQIKHIVFPRDRFLRRRERVDIYTDSTKLAERMVAALNGQAFAGSVLQAHMPRDNFEVAEGKENVLLNMMQRASPGRVAILRGLPAHIKPDRLVRILGREYQLARPTDLSTGGILRSKDEERVVAEMLDRRSTLGSIEEIKLDLSQLSSVFLVRFETVSDAMRFVRVWNGAAWKWTPKDAVNEQRNIHKRFKDEDEADEDEGAALEPDQAPDDYSKEPSLFENFLPPPNFHDGNERLSKTYAPPPSASIRYDFTQARFILDAQLCA